MREWPQEIQVEVRSLACQSVRAAAVRALASCCALVPAAAHRVELELLPPLLILLHEPERGTMGEGGGEGGRRQGGEERARETQGEKERERE